MATRILYSCIIMSTRIIYKIIEVQHETRNQRLKTTISPLSYSFMSVISVKRCKNIFICGDDDTKSVNALELWPMLCHTFESVQLMLNQQSSNILLSHKYSLVEKGRAGGGGQLYIRVGFADFPELVRV